ncbi:hypothetical protein LTR37_012693 [Vermiconidia calcicola]|uniref:Uncharacterized protein n=1 Tax=Vermiconidia calcicola TaxID=1690605 RepID=A0ACC3N1A2_9PEZI|nr:hypothetical protein LTR37_012693 [Vermiconidia calcicola]
MERAMRHVTTIWRLSFTADTPKQPDGVEDAERGPVQSTEKSPLLPRIRTRLKEGAFTTLQQKMANVSVGSLLYSLVLWMVCSVLIFLPMLPFWIFAGFLVYMLGTASSHDFYVYCGVLTVLLPFNMVGTAAIARGVWQDISSG